MKQLVLEPKGWECTLGECPPGFFVYNGRACFKTEYHTHEGKIEVYCESGEVFIGGTKNYEELKKLLVQPCEANWIYSE